MAVEKKITKRIKSCTIEAFQMVGRCAKMQKVIGQSLIHEKQI